MPHNGSVYAPTLNLIRYTEFARYFTGLPVGTGPCSRAPRGTPRRREPKFSAMHVPAPKRKTRPAQWTYAVSIAARPLK
jgi:hypothetical protein